MEKKAKKEEEEKRDVNKLAWICLVISLLNFQIGHFRIHPQVRRIDKNFHKDLASIVN